MTTPTEPVNIAKPKWKCPICGTEHGDNYAAAKACVALGEPDGAGAAETIAVWDHTHGRYDGDDDGLAVVSLGPVKLGYIDADGEVTSWSDDDAQAAHLLTYDNGLAASIGVGVKDGDIVETNLYAVRDAPETAYQPDGGDRDEGLSGFLHRMSIGDRDDRKNGKWPFTTRYGHSWESDYYSNPFRPGYATNGWLASLTDEIRHVFEVLLTDQWARLLDAATNADTDIYDERNRLRGEWMWTGVTTNGRGSGFGFDLRAARYATACTRGFSVYDDIGITRWLFLHNKTVDAWLHDRFYRWVRGDDVTIPMMSATPRVVHSGFHSGLPKKPNKKRVEALARWGVDPEAWNYYSDVVSAALATITVDPPTIDLVQGVPDATEFRSLT